MTQVATRAPRRVRRALVTVAGPGAQGSRAGLDLTSSLGELGIEAIYLGREESARRIAGLAARHSADSIEICLTRPPAIPLLRELLRELIELGRRDVSIVVHQLEESPGARLR